MSELSFQLEVFEGPLDLLLALIKKNNVDIYDIPISEICDQYNDYLRQMAEMDMEIAGEFIVMAAELLLIKSRMLLPKPAVEGEEPEEDPRANLARRLAEYQRAKETAAFLADRYTVFGGRLARETEVLDTRGDLPDSIDPSLLVRAMQRVAEKNSRYADIVKDSEREIEKLLAAKVVPVSSKIYSILRILRRRGSTPFEDILMTAANRSALVAIFIASLELLKVQRIRMSVTEDERVIFILNTSHARNEVTADE
ncbi:MAG: segregation/condensation protein A [Clostridia bacterium]|nr:segregation/condensation protein A [Clostridia bacterium]